MAEMLTWIEAVTIMALNEFVGFMSNQIAAPLWLLLVIFMAGMLAARMRRAGGRMSKAYQRVKVKWAR